MNIIEKTPVPPTEERLHVDLRRLEWARGLSDETLTAITNKAEWVEFHAGQVVIEVDSEVTHVYFLTRGRMHVALYDLLGKEIKKDTYVRGSVVGLFSLGLSDRSYLQVEATEPSAAIRLTLPNLLQLTARHPDFQLAMFRAASNITARNFDRSRPKPSVVGVIHHTEASRPLVGRLARRLRELDEFPCIAGDDEQWKPDGDIPFKLLVGGRSVEEWRDVLKEWSAHRRLLMDLRADHPPEEMIRVLSYVDSVLWCVRPQDASAAVHILQGLEKNFPRWRDKIRLVWLLDNRAPLPPYAPELYEIAERDFKLTFDAPEVNHGSLLQHGFERIINYLRGIQIGMALGGCAARGMAHLGVLKAL